jgi:hypothetical protein
MSTPNAAMITTDPAKNETDFLTRVLPWGQGVANLHWKTKDRPGLPGLPFNRPDDLLAQAIYCNTRPALYGDLYYCLSTQAQTGKSVNGRVMAHRNHENVAALKAIWLDIDVKATEGYPTVVEALDALEIFCVKAQLPPPTALVFSGGGLHVYWISDKPLTLEEWQPYAEGLKAAGMAQGLRADWQCTIDCVRVLRVPGTLNHKTSPGRGVKLMALAPADYAFESALGHIKTAIANIPQSRRTSTATVCDVTKFKQQPFDPSLQDMGLSSLDDPLDWKPLLDEGGCPHLLEAFNTGGAHYAQPLWHLDALLSTFLKSGRRIFHQMSKGHKSYDPGDTDKMFDRKVNDKEGGMGWPSCAALESAGCTSCKTCPYKGKIKSPLNFADPAKPSLTTPAQDGVIRQVKEGKIHPVVALKTLHQRGASDQALFALLNENYAAVRYGSEIMVAAIIGNDVISMTVENFHKVFANVRILAGQNLIEVSKLWFKWPGRRQYLDRGIVFEPGGPSDVAEDMLNLWRGFGIEPKQGDWTLMRNHIFNIVCSKQQDLFDYLIRWLAYAVQHPNEPIGVAVAFRGAPGAGKGIVARTLGKMFGKHFVHIANGDQLTGRFNASLGTACVVFLDEALWAGDKKGEGVLKALITEPRLSLEAKFRDPIMVDNRLRIIVASNEDWVVPTGMGDRRWFILDVANTFAGTGHKDYWDPLYAEVENGGAAAMFYDLLAMDLSGFDVRAVPHTAAKAQQQAHSLRGVDAWLFHVLNEGAIGYQSWKKDGLTVTKDFAYGCFEDFSKHQRSWRPDVKHVWSKKLRELLGLCMEDTRQNSSQRVRAFKFAPLADCRRQFATLAGAPNIEWEPANEEDECPGPASSAAEHS